MAHWASVHIGVLVGIAVWVGSMGVSAQAPPLEKMDIVLRSVPDGPVAHINGASIPRAEFVRVYRMEILRAAAARGSIDAVDDRMRIGLGLRALSNLVNQELLYQEAQKKNLAIPSSKVAERWEAQMAEYREGDATLSETQILEGLGVKDRATVLAEVERMMLIDKMTQQIADQSGVSVTEAELLELYAKNRDGLVRPDTLHIRQLFIRGAKDDRIKADAKGRAERALKRIHAGQRFEGVAKDVSESPGGESGLDMGPWPVTEFPPFLAEAALKLKPGQISGIIESEFGFHIVKLVAAEAGSDLGFEQAKPLLERSFLARRGEEAILNYCDGLINGEADILVYLELEKSLATDPRFQDIVTRD